MDITCGLVTRLLVLLKGEICMFKKAIKNPLFLGNSITSVVSCATNTLIINFILSKGMNVYQIQVFAVMVLSMIMSIVISKHMHLTKVAYNNYKTFMLVEGVAQLLVGFASLITGSSIIYIIVSILMVPFNKIEDFGNIEIMNNIPAPERKEFDQISALYSAYISVAGYAMGFVLNLFMTGASAFCLYCIAGALNNVFYWKAYKMYPATDTTDSKAA